jgi:hypothetical protein
MPEIDVPHLFQKNKQETSEDREDPNVGAPS